METPRSDTPSYSASRAAAELDDHRFQPHALPRSNIMTGRPDVLQMDGDNEHPVFDDADMHSPDVRSTDHAPDAAQGRRGPVSQCNVRDDAPSIRFPSRASSRSSPPNSVDAFADPEQLRRRDRAATLESQLRGDLGLTLQRTISRRPTFTEPEERSRGSADDTPSLKAEEDVCFPPPEEPRVRGAIIDFDEMDEFVQMQNRGRQGERQRKMSTAGSFKSGYLPVLGQKPNSGTVVESVDDECVVDESSSAINEKSDNLGTSRAQSRRNMTPDRFSFFSSEMDTTIHAPQIGDLLCDDEGFYDLFHGGQGVWWLDCLDPSPDELAMLMKAFAIHPLTAEDIRVQETREKVELFRNYYFVCFRSFVQQKSLEGYMDPINIYIIVFGEGVLSFHFTPSNHSANVRRRIRQLRDYVALSSDWICYALIDDIVDSFAPVITDIENDSDAIEDAVFVARSEDYSALLKRIGDCRKKTMGGMRLLGGKADVIKGFAKRCNEQYSVTPRGEIGLYLGDIQDHIITMMGNLSHFEKMLSRSHANYLAQLSVDSIQANNRANEVLSRITTIGTILVPLNLVCGLFGMNVTVPGEQTGSLGWFFGILGSIVLFCCVCFCVAKRWKLV